jgi:phosphatidylglycerophosphate synthase
MHQPAAVITTVSLPGDLNKKICGLYPIERNIMILFKAGIENIYLNITGTEKEFFLKKIHKHLKKLKNINIIEGDYTKKIAQFIEIPSNLFMQLHYIEDIHKYFKKKGKSYQPVLSNEQFILVDDEDFKRGQDLAVKKILDNTKGFIARNINKRISIPISLVISKTRIHPNILTIFNMIIGLLSAFFLVQNTYWSMVLGGFLFQLASVFDGVDGEVAKFTLKFSKIGSWLDTISDNTTLLLFLSAVSYLFFKHFAGYTALLVVIIMFIGFIGFIYPMIRYLRLHSNTASLVAYEKEFLEKLPRNDILVNLVIKAKYFTKKEFFALFYFFICFTGRIYLLIPLAAIIMLLGAASLIILNKRYMGDFDKQPE